MNKMSLWIQEYDPQLCGMHTKANKLTDAQQPHLGQGVSKAPPWSGEVLPENGEKIADLEWALRISPLGAKLHHTECVES